MIGTTESVARDAAATGERGAAMIGCTIATRELLPRARVLAASFKSHHPGCRFVILMADAFVLGAASEDDTELLDLEDIPLAPEDAHRLPKIYAPGELRHALTPWLLRALLLRTSLPVLYFEPDIEVFAPLTEAADLASLHRLVLTPGSSSGNAHEPGFLAVAPGGESFLDWWCARLREDFDAGRSIRSSLLDEIPEGFSRFVLPDPSYNLGYWNVREQQLTWLTERYFVGNRPLRFFRFRGYDLAKPHLLTSEAGVRPPVLLSEAPTLRKLCTDYRDQVLAEEAAGQQRDSNRFELPSGIGIDRHMHWLYAQAECRYHARQGPQPPSPFLDRTREAAFLKWLNQRTTEGKPEITRYMLAMHTARPDLQAAFPEPLGRDATAFHTWFVTTGAPEERVSPRLLPSDAAPASPAPSAAEPTGNATVNVVGYFRAELGIGEAARLLITGLEAAGIPYITTAYDRTGSRQQHEFAERQPLGSESDINIVCVNADQLPAFAEHAGPRLAYGRHTIGVWFWEVDEFPESFGSAFRHLNEVWVATEFVRDTLLKVSPKPVSKFHLPIVKPEIDPAFTRAQAGLPDRFLFLFSFDFFSVLERKNPVGLVEAFKRAFQPGEGPVLVIKTINGEQRVLEMEKLKYAIGDQPDIMLMDGYMSALQKNTMTALCDCYVSLHRSEGFGLTMAEAMALGKPVIATGFSGNIDFMTSENSYLCAFQLSEVGPEREPYPAHALWAEPDLDDAVRLLRHVYDYPEEAHARGARAARDVAELHSPAVAGAAIAAQLAGIRRRRSASGRADRIAGLQERLEHTRAAERALTRALQIEEARSNGASPS